MKQLLVTTAAILGLTLGSQAQVVFQDNFESGNLNNWTSLAGAMSASTAQKHAGTYSAKQTTSADKLIKPLGQEISARYKATFWIYDGGGTDTSVAANRAYGEVRAYSAAWGSTLLGLAAAGRFWNTFGGQTGDINEIASNVGYHGRLLGGDNTGWFNLNAPGAPVRSEGWHKFDIEKMPDGTLRFYCDGILGRVVTGVAAWTVDHITIGSVASGTSPEGAYYDDVKLIMNHPAIVNHPVDTVATVGDPVVLPATADGLATLTYQWRRNGTNLVNGNTPWGSEIVGANTATLTINNSQEFDSGVYSLFVSNSLDVCISSNAIVTVNPAILISQHPQNQAVNPGSDVTFNVVATGQDVLFYQWYFGNASGTNEISGETTETLSLSNVQTNQTGFYFVIISDSLGNPPQTSQAAKLTVNLPPLFTGATNINISVGSSFSYRPAVTDDVSVHALPFQDFETYTNNALVMFRSPNTSQSTATNLLNPTNSYTRVASTFPTGHAGTRALKAAWQWDPIQTPWLRFTTGNGGSLQKPNSIISVEHPLRFDIYVNHDLLVALGVRETNPTGAYGENGGSTVGTSIEFIGVSNGGNDPTPVRTVSANTWTTMTFDIPNLAVEVANFSAGNGVINSTSGKAVLEMLCLKDPYYTGEPFEMFLDNFIVVPTNGLLFELVTSPSGATIDELTGDIFWQPPGGTGTYNFTVRATDSLGLSSTYDLVVDVSNVVTPPNLLITRQQNGNVTLSWTGNFLLRAATSVQGTYNVVSGATSPYTVTPNQAAQFYRLSSQ